MSSQTPSKLRPPAPSLFVGPSSRNASNTSLLPNPAAATRAPLIRQRSMLGEKPLEGPAEPTLSPISGPKDPLVRRQQQQQQVVEEQSAKRTDEVWAEMQNTLEEVELSATNGTQVFGASHGKALNELRTAQIELAQAWARSEADEEGSAETEQAKNSKKDKMMAGSSLLASERVDKLDRIGTAASKKGDSGTSTDGHKASVEEDTENDIAAARKRREANDRYFQRVNAGVLDVVAKLEEVAQAMKGVEQESKEIWGDGDSTASMTTGAAT